MTVALLMVIAELYGLIDLATAASKAVKD